MSKRLGVVESSWSHKVFSVNIIHSLSLYCLSTVSFPYAWEGGFESSWSHKVFSVNIIHSLSLYCLSTVSFPYAWEGGGGK